MIVNNVPPFVRTHAPTAASAASPITSAGHRVYFSFMMNEMLAGNY
jgi:hypothetical protein